MASTPAWLEYLGQLGSFASGLAEVTAVLLALGAWRDWERKRARDRRADVATRLIRRVAVACEEMAAAINGPSLRLGWEDLAAKHREDFVPATPRQIRDLFDERMARALDQLRELFMLHVEARVHLDRAEALAVGRLLSEYQQAETSARTAVLSADDLSSPEIRKQLTARLTEVDRRITDAREELVGLLGPVARDGRATLAGAVRAGG